MSEEWQIAESLREAIELAEEGWEYASPYFRQKWQADARLARLRGHLAAADARDWASNPTQGEEG